MHGPLDAATDPISRAIARARGVLPDQGPIGVFIHQNTLHAFQHLPFHEGVQAGADALGAEPYLTLEAFRSAFRSGRIADADLRLEIHRFLGERAVEPILGRLTREALWHQLLASESDTGDASGLEFMVQAGVAPQCADRERWEACRARVAAGPAREAPPARAARRHRDVIVALGGDDPDPPLHGELIRLGSGYLDQGHAHAHLPGREHGFFRAVAALYAAGGSPPRLCRGADADFRVVHDSGGSARAAIESSLAALAVSGDDVEPFLLATALALPGWAGMFARLEQHPDDHPGGPPASLEDFLAVRLILERRAVERVCASHQIDPAWSVIRTRMPALEPRPPVLDAALLWSVSSAASLLSADVLRLTDDEVARLWEECESCSEILKRQVFHDAYERTYRRQILDAVAARRDLPPDDLTELPRAQFIFCIDEREESIRRAVEEQHPGYITFGAAGFFGVAIDYLGLYDREPAAHCPVVVTPGHEVHEQPVYTDLGWHELRRRFREQWHALERRALSASRTLSGGAGMSFLLGPVSAVKTLAHVIAPRASSRMSDRMLSRLAPLPGTRLSALRPEGEAAKAARRKPLGFLLEESIDRVFAMLTSIGLVRDFAPIVVVLGHGSTSLNNPHESAHDCGACGGRRGGANARLFADMANRHDVREGVRRKGIEIPSNTWFVGALHDTASDEVRYYDLELLPVSHAARFSEAYEVLERARRASALERCRRFDDAPLDLTPEAALHHVESRSANLAQPRPEYGHCTNSICIVGRRSLTRGLHLDRRAFLVSYDPTIDPSFGIVERILAAVGPVGAGISLEYYFSSVDNEQFGCGTKLPHNVTGLIGVMNGHQSDLLTGLPLQMVEIHEPMRLLLIVDATPEALLAVAGRQPEVAELVVKQWIQVVAADPNSGAMHVFEDGRFVPYEPTPALLPVVEHSAEWHMRTRDHLPPALVRRALPESAVGPGHRADAEIAVVPA